MPILDGAEPFHHDGDDVGVLVCHGFTGTPQSMRPLAKAFADAGHTVRLPRLPGHGTTWQDCNTTTWQDWYGAVHAEMDELRARTRTVVVAGMSMGGALAICLAAEYGPAVSGLVLINPCVRVDDPRLRVLPVLQRLVPSLPGIADDRKMVGGEAELAYDRNPLKALYSQTKLWAKARAELPSVTTPVLLFRSRTDNVVPWSSGDVILSTIGSRDVTEVVLEDSYHVATLDNDAPRIVADSVAFAARVTAPATQG